MKILKKRGTERTVEEVVLRNTGCKSAYELDSPREYDLRDAEEFADFVLPAISDGLPVYIRGDYDADGVTSTAQLVLFFRAFGVEPDVHLPHRFSEGYGLSDKMIDDIPAGDGLLITVDNGITARSQIAKAKDKGLTVVVVDHHLPPEDGVLPDADLIIDPAAIEGSSDFVPYCAAGLVYKLLSYMAKSQPAVAEILPRCLSFAAIGTVADAVPLLQDNRRIVKEGLKSLETVDGTTSGLRALLRACSLKHAVSAKDTGFRVAPCTNASGRLKDDGAQVVLSALLFDGADEDADILVLGPVSLNERRKMLKNVGLVELLALVRDEGRENDCPLVVYSPDLHEGIIGIYAGELAERFCVPCIVFTDAAASGVIKGSARSAGGVHLKHLLDTCKQYFLGYGGHADAAGMSIRRDDLESFRRALAANISYTPSEEERNTAYYDIEADYEDMADLLFELQRFEPYGEGNPAPVFLLRNVPLCTAADGEVLKTMGGFSQHLRLHSPDAEIMAFDGTRAVAERLFEGTDTEEAVREALKKDEYATTVADVINKASKNLNIEGKTIDVVCELSMNNFGDDAAPQIEATEVMINDT